MRLPPLCLLLAALLGAAAFATAASRASEPAAEPAGSLMRWSEGTYRWHYSRAQQPEWLDPGVGLHLFRSAAEAWSGCGLRIEFAGETDLRAGSIDGQNVVGWSASLQRGLRGITIRRRAGAGLAEADVVINAANAEFRASPDLLRKVVLHEFGHALGLVHSPDCGDVMSFGAACRHVATGALPRQPAAGDLVQCAKRYGAERARN